MEPQSRQGAKGIPNNAIRDYHLCAFAPLRLIPTALIQYFTHGVTLAYRTYGSGALPILAFHGFGRTGADFAVLEPELADRCTLYAFDLHFHGASPRYPGRADVPFTPHELAEFFAAFADRIGCSKITLLGYSLGGRLALSLLEQVPGRIERAFLVAPDGLKTRPWYRGLASSPFGRRLYKRFVERPGAVHALINGLRALRLMNERMHRFLIGQTDSRIKRELVRDVWLSYRMIEPDLGRVAANVEAHGMHVYLFFGTNDRVIPPRLGEAIRPKALEWISQQELPTGHILLIPALGTAIASLLDGGQ